MKQTNGIHKFKERHYRFPPVQEALLEAYFIESKVEPNFNETFPERLLTAYPVKEIRKPLSVEVQFSKERVSTTAGNAPERTVLKQEDGSRLVQFEPNLLVVNQLKPYPSFGVWFPEFLRIFKIFGTMARPTSINKLGLRYINKIEIPGKEVSLEDYFSIAPNLPKPFKKHGAFMLRITIESLFPRHQLLTTFGSAPSEKEGNTGFLLDIYDVLEQRNEVKDETVQRFADEAHQNIVNAFEGAIKSKLRILFKEIRK